MELKKRYWMALLVVMFLVVFSGAFQASAKEDIASITKKAEQGNAGAQCKLGHVYAEGKGKPQDDKQAVAWYRKAAEQGDAGGQYYLGVMYEKGQGVSQDDIYAYAWYSLAAAQGIGNTSETRDKIAKKFNSKQRSQAQRLAAELQAKIGKQAPQVKELSPPDEPVAANALPASGSTSEMPTTANAGDKVDLSPLNAIYDPPKSEPQPKKSDIDIALIVIGILFIFAVYMATTKKAKVSPFPSSKTGQTASDPESEIHHHSVGTTPSSLMTVCEKCSHPFSKRASLCPKCKAPRIACCAVCNHNIATDCQSCPECGDPNPFGKTLNGVLTPPTKLGPAIISLPWQRYWARSIDYALFLVVFNVVVALLSMNGPMVSDNVIIELATLFILSLVSLILYEATWLSAAATTPGKALFSIKVYTKQGESLSFGQAFGRSFSALASGFAFLIFFPFIPMLTMWKSYKEIKNTGSASWDKKEGHKVIHQSVGSPRLWTGVALGLVAVVTISLIALVGKQMTKEMIREQFHQKHNIHRK